ncbi:MAG TPA: phospholipid carrier-dependent glycosyltransferase [Candidatus Dormibacteraeota bacterium]|nr:phospholipid carrier-dependent glycosyltransferase [Candidatus Dormibacteraeota bacterium]
MSVPAIGEPDPHRAEPSRTGFGDAAAGILVLLGLGLALRIIILRLIPGSGFGVDLASFQFWASNLAHDGLSGFYGRDFFHDYTPGYLYVLWIVGGIGNLVGGVGDLIKIPPILADLALGYLVWSMTRELGGSERAARIGAALVIFNPVTWFDSTVWGQVDSVGVVVLLLALRELWRDRPERAAVLATLAALIKPQLGILIPLVAIVVIRRAFWPEGGYGADGEPEPRRTTTAWERRVRGPIRVVTTALAGLLTAILVSLPFGLSFPGLVAQIFKAAAGYPYLSVNAFNPWALLTQAASDGHDQSIALTRTWVCDATITPSPPGDFRIGDWVIWSWPASTTTCPVGVDIGAFPAVLVGSVLFVIAAAIVVWLVGRRPDRITMLVALAVLALAFFDLPTRVHERYLFPLAAIGAILAAVSLRWRIAYVLSAAATFANMYVVLTTYYPNNPQISDWLGIGQELALPWGVAIASVIQAAILGWAFFQLRDEATEGLAEDVELAGRGGVGRPLLRNWFRRPAIASAAADFHDFDELDAAHDALPAASSAPAGWTNTSIGPAPAPAAAEAGAAGAVTLLPAWETTRDAGALGPWAWFRARLNDTPVRADRTRLLERERGGRLDKLDLWVLVVLAIAMFTVRMWRLDEPYQMHFDEVYHPRTATEFLQYWKYGISHDIYEWTHPHLAKYAMALGLVTLGEDHVSSRSQLGAPVVDAVIEPRRDDGLDPTQVQGDRLWVATGTEVRAYDLATRDLAGTLALSGAVAVAYDPSGHALYVGTRTGEIRIVDVGNLDASRRGPPGAVDSRAFMNVGGPIQQLYVTRDGTRLAAVLAPGFGSTDASRSTIVVIDTGAAAELGRPALDGVTQLTAGFSDHRIAVGTSNGIAFIDETSGTVSETFDVGGAVKGLVGINNIQDDPLYASVATKDGPKVAVVIAKTGDTPPTHLSQSFTLPGETAGRAYYDLASEMVHIEGAVQTSDGTPGADTIYVIEPHGNAVYADATLGQGSPVPVAMVLDQNQDYPSSDREQLLAFDAGGGVAAIEIGRHAYAWRVPGVVAGVLMFIFLYILARLLFRRRSIAVILGLVVLVDGMLFAQSRIGMNDSYVGLGIVAAYTIFTWLWLHPGNSRRHWVAFAIGVPLMGAFLGFALASKWVAAYAIGGLGLLVLTRSALGRLLLIIGLLGLTTALGYVAISVPAGQDGGNYVFLAIMIGLVLVAVLANVIHPIAWTLEELRFAVGTPIALGLLAVLWGLRAGDATVLLTLGSVAVSPIVLGLLGFLVSAVAYVAFYLVGRLGFGPLAPLRTPDDPTAILDAPAEAPVGWLRLGTGFGLPAIWLVVGLLVIPIGLYILSYVPWAYVENHQLFDSWPVGHTGQTLVQLTQAMYDYHNNLSSAHPASSPWWAWTFDLKPVWFYEEGFAGGTSASIYDAGNLVSWWLGVPALAFVVWQAFKRRSAALTLIAIGFAAQWLSWARIDRAAFQYHYYTSLPFVFLALAYFLAELWHGTSRRIWLFARLSGAGLVLLPSALWVLDRPLCAVVRVTDIVPNSQACPAMIPDVTIQPRAIAIAVIIGVGVLLLLRELLSVGEEDEPAELDDERAAGGWRGLLARLGLGSRWANAAAISIVTTIAFIAASALIPDARGFTLTNIPVEPIALIVLVALTPVAAYVATARDSRRFVLGALAAMAVWFVVWYPNISALPLPAALHNAYQGFLPTYLYPFQFWVLQGTRAAAPPLFAIGPAFMLASLTFMAVVVGYSAWSWRVALAERRLDALAAPDDRPGAAAGAD